MKIDQTLRIALLNSSDRGGGAERIVSALRDGLSDQGHRAHLWVGRKRGKHPSKDIHLIPRSNDEHDAALRFANKGFFNLGVPSSKRFCNSDALHEIDIIHLHNVHGHYFSVTDIPDLATRAPLVWTFHDYFPISGGCAFPYECDRWLSQCGQCPQLGQYPIATTFDRTRRMQSIKRQFFHHLPVTIITPSTHLTRAVEDSGMFAAADVRTIPYGVDTTIFYPDREESRKKLDISNNRPVVMLAAQGLDDPRKGLHHAVEALRDVDVPDLLILLIGGGEDHEIVQSLGKHEVRAMGYVTDPVEMARMYAASDLFLFTSLAENYPCVVMESMASGTAVLAFDINGVIEQMEDGLTGFLVTTANTKNLAQAAQMLLTDRKKLIATGFNARQHACQQWKIELFLDRHIKLYQDILERNRFDHRHDTLAKKRTSIHPSSSSK